MLKVDLKRGAVVGVRDGAGSIITAHTGLLWVTEQESVHDVVLRAGDSFTLARPGLALVQAFGDASVSVRGARGLAFRIRMKHLSRFRLSPGASGGKVPDTA